MVQQAVVEYREFAPRPELAGFVRCYWTLEGGSESAGLVQRILPDGSMEMVFHLADPFLLSGVGQNRALLVGQQWAPVQVSAQQRSDCVGIRFQARGAFPFLRFSQSEVAGVIVNLEEAWGRQATLLWQRLGEAATVERRVAVLDSFLLELSPQPPEQRGHWSVRHARRRFEREVGISPKLHGRIRRFQRALAALQRTAAAVAAIDCGYYDQAHLNRDFRQFAGMTPKAWLREKDGVLFFQYGEDGAEPY